MPEKESTQENLNPVESTDGYESFKASQTKKAEPVQPPAEKKTPSAEAEKPAKETAGDPDTPSTQEEKPAKKKPERKPDAEHRIEELLREKRERDERIAALERENADFRTKSVEKPRETPPAPENKDSKPASDKPKLADFVKKAVSDPANANRPYEEVTAEAQEAWEEAVFDWRDKKRETETRSRSVAERTAQQAAKSREKHADFDAVINNAGGAVLRQLAPPAVLAFRDETDNGTDVLYHLASNQAELARIAALSPLRQVQEVFRLSESLKTPAPEAAPEKTSNVRPITRVPAPQKHVLGGGAMPADQKPLSEAGSYEEFKTLSKRKA